MILAQINAIFKRWHPAFLYFTSLVFVFVLFITDILTGYEINFFIFYGFPVWIATFYIGRNHGLFFAAVCTLAWYLADTLSLHAYEKPWIVYWNAGASASFFLLTVFVITLSRDRFKQAEVNANYDALTHILNARGFREKVGTLLPLLKRQKEVFTLAFIDVDNFKAVNDTMGHAEGDRVLQVIAATLKDSLRESDLEGRMGGDEFVVFLPRTDLEKSKTVLNKLKTTLDETSRKNSWPIGFSIGAAVFDSGAARLEEAISSTDALMYQVKKRGKNSILYQDISAQRKAAS